MRNAGFKLSVLSTVSLLMALLPAQALANPPESPLAATYNWAEHSYYDTGLVQVWDSTGWLVSSVYDDYNSCAAYGLTATKSFQNGIYEFPSFHNRVWMRVYGTPSAPGSCTYRIRIDKQGTDTDDYVTWTIDFANVNEAPYDISFTGSSINENQPSGTLVGSLSTSDPDLGEGGDSHTYSLVSGDTGSFYTSGNKLYTNASFDYETKSSYNVTIRTTDAGGLSYNEAFNITVNDVNEAPTDIYIAGNHVAENSPTNTQIGTLSSTDPDSSSFTYSLVSAYGDNASFNIAGNFLQTSAAFDYETKPTLSIRVRSTDPGGQYLDKDFTISVDNVNEAPNITNAKPSPITVLEDGSQELTVTATDPENDTLSYIVISEPDHGAADFSGNKVTYTPGANYNGSDSFTVRASDGSLNDTLIVNVTVTAVNDEPSFTKGDNETVNEDVGLVSRSGWATGISRGPSDEAGQTLTFYLSNDNNSLFTQQPAVASDGALTYRPANNAHGSATVSIYLKDNGGTNNGGDDTSGTQSFTITVNPVNDAPVLNTSGSPYVTAIDEDDTTNSGMLVSALLATGANGDPISDVDDNVAEGIGEGIAVIAVDNTYGAWQYSTNAGVDWIDFGSPSVSNARLLASNANTRVRFAPNANWNGVVNPALTFRAWDQKPGYGGNGETDDLGIVGTGFETPFSSEYEFASLVVNPVNDAPVLDNSGTMSLSPIREDEVTSGTLISQIIASAETHGEDRITDIDQNSGVGYFGEGIAIYAADVSHGSWECSIDNGVNWNPLGDVSQTSARLLNTNNFTRLRFLPVSNWNTEGWGEMLPTVTFNAWDRSSGLNGDLADMSALGGISPFSTANQNASISVVTLNDRPTFTRGVDISIDEDSLAQTISPWATNISPGPDDEVNFFHQQTHFNIVYITRPELFTSEGQPQLSTDGALTFTPAQDAYGEATVIINLQDDGGTLVEGSQDTSTYSYLVITLNGVNDAPSFTKGSDITVPEDSDSYSLDSWVTDLFKGPENESWQELSFIITDISNPGLFDPTKNGVSPVVDPAGRLTFRPADNENGTTTVSIKIHDSGGTFYGGVNESPEQSFTITINPVNDPPVNTVLPQVSGQAYVDETLTGTDGIWNDDIDLAPGNLTYTYQWQRANDNEGNGLSDILGAVSAQYQLTLADSGKYIRIKATAQDDGEGEPASQSTDAFSAFTRIEIVNQNVQVVEFAKISDEDILLNFTSSDFTDHFTPNSGGSLERIRLTALPQHGTLFLDSNANGEIDGGEAVILNQEILAAVLANLAYLPESQWYGSASFKWNATDAIANGYPLPGTGVTVSLTVNAVNDAPTVVAPPAFAVHEDTDSLPFTFTLDDIDVVLADPVATNYEVTLSDDFGTFTLASTVGLTFIDGSDNSSDMTVSGALVDLQATFDGVVYHPMAGYTGQDDVTITIRDNGNTGLGEPLSATATTSILISDVNNAPVNVLPQPFTVDINTTSSPMDFEFMDDSNSYMQFAFTAEHGSMILPDLSSMTLISGGNETHAMTYRGPVLKVIKALQKLRYRPDTDYAGPDTITFTTNDLGGTGTGGAKSDTDTLSVIVNAPPVAVADDYFMFMNETLSVPAPGLLANDSDVNTDPLTITIVSEPAAGNLELNQDGSFDYIPPVDYTGIVTFTYQLSDGRLESEIVEVPITVEGDMQVSVDYEINGFEITYTFTAENPTEHHVFNDLELIFNLGEGSEVESITNGAHEPTGGEFGYGLIRSIPIPEFKPGETFVMTWTIRLSGLGKIAGSWSFDNSETSDSGTLDLYRLAFPFVMK